jgi:choline dehydrogenase-like flavoprotein
MGSEEYDVVIVGGGVSGALVANDLASRGLRVVVLEAGPALRHPEEKVRTFYGADIKTPDSPWPNEPQAQRPTVLDMGTTKDFKDEDKYMAQTGEIPFNSTYERVGGGTSTHWLGTCLRHVPNDFRLRSNHPGAPLLEHARDWPISYDDLEPWYLRAEREVGVAGDSKALADFLGAKRSAPYPMSEIPLSHLDQRLAERLDGQVVDGTSIRVLSTPQGRNSREYPTREDARAHGTYWNPQHERYRCLGNTSCIPICPIQAKWDASAHLRSATSEVADGRFPDRVPAEVRYKSVAYQVCVGEDDRIERILYKDYGDPDAVQDREARGRVYVLAGHAIETPKLLLNSPWKEIDGQPRAVANRSDQVGRNLMDHIIHLTWGLADEPVFPFRGPLSTAGIGEFRDGAFRGERAAFRVEIGNDGWSWPDGAPLKTVWEVMSLDRVDELEEAGQDVRGIRLIEEFFQRPGQARGKWYGKDLRRAVRDVVTRQVRMAAEPEALPLPTSRVTLSTAKKDPLGIPTPEVHYDVSEYTKKGFAAATGSLARIFELLGVTKTVTTILGLESAAAVFEYDGQKYEYGGAGHIAGTYRMGTDPEDSVVDADCRCHDHPNMYLLGSGVFPALGTANPTLTIMALALRAADRIATDLGGPVPEP